MHAAIVSVALRNCIGEDVPVCYVQVQAEPSVQHIGGFADAGLQRDGLCLALDKMENNNQLLHLYWCSAKVLHYETRVLPAATHKLPARSVVKGHHVQDLLLLDKRTVTFHPT